MSDFKKQLEEEVQQHNEVHNQIQAGEEQIAALKEERSRRVGRITLLQELVESGGSDLPEPSVQGEVVE